MRRPRTASVVIVGVLLGVTAGLAMAHGSGACGHDALAAAPARALVSAPVPTRGRWIASWSASPEAAAPASPFAGGFRDQTIRNVIYPSAGGTLVRVRLDNTFGDRALEVARAAIAVSGPGAAVLPGTSVPLSFAGRRSTVIPSGAQAFSDPVHLEVRPLERLAVSVFLPRATGAPTQHDDTHESNYLAAGDRVLAGGATCWGSPLDPWYFVSGLDVWSSALGAVVTLGDSITNGNGSATGANAGWPDDLARRLAALPGAPLSVVDAGIDGNRVLLSPTSCCGPSAVARFRRDVLRQSGVAEVIVLEGIDDITSKRSTNPLAVPHVNVSAAEIIAAYRQLISRAHAAGLKIFGSTLTPFAGSRYWTRAGEAEREAVNAWTRSSGAFDGVIDFARVLADPNDPVRLNPRFDDGDHEHPNDAGYQAMANAINMTKLTSAARKAFPGPCHCSDSR
jgi:lysophospholipase L1-like esterase